VRVERLGTVAAGVVAWAWVDAQEVDWRSWWRPLGARFLVLLVWFVVAMVVGQLLALVWWVGGVMVP
jgi:hypothetical protein